MATSRPAPLISKPTALLVSIVSSAIFSGVPFSSMLAPTPTNRFKLLRLTVIMDALERLIPLPSSMVNADCLLNAKVPTPMTKPDISNATLPEAERSTVSSIPKLGRLPDVGTKSAQSSFADVSLTWLI